jgi:hypothetical protein
MRDKILILFLLTTLAAAVGAYLSNAYQRHKQDGAAQAQTVIERQPQDHIDRAQPGHRQLDRNDRNRPDR